jgi:hypothetical protein
MVLYRPGGEKGEEKLKSIDGEKGEENSSCTR